MKYLKKIEELNESSNGPTLLDSVYIGSTCRFYYDTELKKICYEYPSGDTDEQGKPKGDKNGVLSEKNKRAIIALFNKYK